MIWNDFLSWINQIVKSVSDKEQNTKQIETLLQSFIHNGQWNVLFCLKASSHPSTFLFVVVVDNRRECRIPSPDTNNHLGSEPASRVWSVIKRPDTIESQKFITWQPSCQNNQADSWEMLSQPRLTVAGSWMAAARSGRSPPAAPGWGWGRIPVSLELKRLVKHFVRSSPVFVRLDSPLPPFNPSTQSVFCCFKTSVF